MLKLYSYFRSSAAYRARMTFNLKGLPQDEMMSVHLRQDDSQPRMSDFTVINPRMRVPMLAGGERLTQSLADICPLP